MLIGLVVAAGCQSASGPEDEEQGGNLLVASVEVNPGHVVLAVGETHQLTAIVRNADRQVLGTAVVAWSTSNAATASVNPVGVVTGTAAGTTVVVARSGGKADTATVVVVDDQQPAVGDLNVDLRTTYQEISGWEATAWVGNFECNGFPTVVYQNYKNAVFDGALDLGINRMRLEVRAGAERPDDLFTEFTSGVVTRDEWRETWYDAVNDNGDPFSINPAGFHFGELDLAIDRAVLPLKQRLEARGERLYVNLNFLDFQPQSGFEHRLVPEEYAELILAVFQHIDSKYGWVPDAVEIILEPDNNSPVWTASQIGNAIVAAGSRLAAAGWQPDFIAPSGKSMAWSLSTFDALINVPGVRNYITDIAYHRYGGVSSQTLQAIGQRGVQYGLRTAMLEHIGSGYVDLHTDLTTGRNSAWQQYALAGCAPGDPGGRHFLIDASNPALPIVTLASRSHFLRQYFKYVRAGAVRVGAASTIGALDPVAFVNADGGTVVVVKAGGARNFTIGGLPAGRYGIVYTVGSDDASPQQSAVNQGDVTIGSGEVLSTSIPGRGVITIFAK